MTFIRQGVTFDDLGSLVEQLALELNLDEPQEETEEEQESNA